MTSSLQAMATIALLCVTRARLQPGQLRFPGGWARLAMWAWDYNTYGQLGDGTTTTRTTPVQVNGLGVTKYYFFNGQRVAMRKEGVLYYVAGDHPSLRSGQAWARPAWSSVARQGVRSARSPTVSGRWPDAARSESLLAATPGQ